MATTLTTIDVSEWQDPETVDWSSLISQGLQSVIVRLSHGFTADKKASAFVKKAQSLDLIVHGYHFYEGNTEEVSFSVRNAQQIGLPNGAHFFLDMEGNIPGDWQTILYQFAPEWLRNGWKPGLYCSDSPYKAKFDNAKLVSDKITRWIASYDYEPANYDVRQYTSSNGKLDLDYDKSGLLEVPYEKAKHKPDSSGSSTDNFPPLSPGTPTGDSWVGWGKDSRYGGGKTLGYSPNGKDFYAVFWPGGLVIRPKDAEQIWELLKDKIKRAGVDVSNLTIPWDKVTNKPNIPDVSNLAKLTDVHTVEATAESAVSKAEKAQSTAEANSKALADKANKSEIPNLSGYALKSELPSLDGYAKLTDIPSVAGLVKEAELADYAKKSDLPNLSGYVKVSDLIDYAKKTDIPQSLSWDKVTGKPDVALKSELPSITGLAKETDLARVKATAESAESKAEQAQSTANSKVSSNYQWSVVAMDYNDIKTGGVYYNAENGDNYHAPAGDWGYLIVNGRGNGACSQLYLGDNTAGLYWRTFNGYNWSNWVKVASTNDLSGLVSQSALNQVKDLLNEQIAKKADASAIPSLDGYAKLTDIPSVSGLVKEAELADYAKLADVPKSMSWNQITGKPILALKSDIPNVSGFLKQADLADYAKKTDIPQAPDLSVYAKKSDIPSLDGYAKMSDLPSVTGLVKQTDLVGYAKTSEVDEVKAIADNALSTAEKAQSTANANSKALADKADKSAIPSLDGYAKLTDIPSVTGLVKEAELAEYAKKSDIPKMPDLSGYVTASSLMDYVKRTELPDFTQFAKKSEVPADVAHTSDLANYALKSEIPKMPDLSGYALKSDLPIVPTDLVHTSDMNQVKADVSQAKQEAEKAATLANNVSLKFDTSKYYTYKAPNAYTNGITLEWAYSSNIGLDEFKDNGSTISGFCMLTTKIAVLGSLTYARQKAEVVSGDYPYTFLRNGLSSGWSPWHQVTAF